MDRRALIRKYFDLLETFSVDDREFEAIIHPEVEQVEFPNLLNRKGQKSDLADLKKRAAIGKKILSNQKYDITNIIESDNRVAIETTWRATMAIAAPPFKQGQELKAFFCVVLTFKDGKIIRQHNYDCIEDFN